MAIDRSRTKEMIETIDGLFEELIPDKVPLELKQTIKDKVMGPAFAEIHNLIDTSRPPVLFLLGRSGHGKSTLINRLAGQIIAEEGTGPKSETYKATKHTVQFPEQFATWSVIDTRGFFEAIPAEDTPDDKGALTQVIEDAIRYQPDIILHVISAPEVRSLGPDKDVIEKINAALKEKLGAVPPTVTVLSKIDTIGDPLEWPPETNDQKSGEILEYLDHMAKDYYRVSSKPIDEANPIKGCQIIDNGESNVIGVIPVRAYKNNPWNIDTLTTFIGGSLPESAQLDFFQALRRKDGLKRITSGFIKRFAGIAGSIGSLPIPIGDAFLLVPLQLLLVLIIAALSCRRIFDPDTKEINKQVVGEFLSATGINMAIGYGLRLLAQQFSKLIPFGGIPFSAAIAASGTYAIGKSAEAYFFNKEIRKPEEFKEDWPED